MKLRLLAGLLLVATGAFGVLALLRAQDAKPAKAMPGIRIDASEIERPSTPVVTSYADALEEIRLSVVSVYSNKIVRPRTQGFPYDDPFFRRFFGPGGGQREERVQQGLGSGVVISADGYILTNNHVIEGSDEIRVALVDGRELGARVIGVDPRTDIAVVKVDATDLKHATLADSDRLRVGDVVFAVGNPLGVGQTTTMGIVSATGRSKLRLIDEGYENFIQTDASINPGNSGGALVDAMGRVVGINTAILSTSRGSIGIGFAIPVNLAANVMRSLIETGSVARGYLGVTLQDLDADLAQEFGVKDGKGVVILEVQPGGPAATAGLRQGDVVTAIEGGVVVDTSALRLVVSQMLPGTKARVRIVRDGVAQEVAVTLGRMPDGAGEPDQLLEGVRVAPLTPELRQQFGIDGAARGIVVVEVDSSSRHAAALPVGTVIEQINRRNITDLAEARDALGRGRNILLLNLRGVYRYVAITVN